MDNLSDVVSRLDRSLTSLAGEIKRLRKDRNIGGQVTQAQLISSDPSKNVVSSNNSECALEIFKDFFL